MLTKMTEAATEYDRFMHKSAHQAWKSKTIVDPVTKKVLGLVDEDRYQFSNYSFNDTHADICLQDFLTRPSLKDVACQCQLYADLCLKEALSVKPKFLSVREHNLNLLKGRGH
jgi:hypothetical protein